MSTYTLRAWVGVLGVGTLIAGFRCLFFDDFAESRFSVVLEQVSPLLLRTYVVGALLGGATRIAYAISPHNSSLYLGTLVSFLLACAHLWFEVDISSISDVRLVLLVVTTLWMVISWLLRGTSQAVQKDVQGNQSLFVKLLRLWVGLVGIVALVNGVQCHLDSTFSARRIYTLMPQQATPLSVRTFGSWTILAGVVRAGWAWSPRSMSLYLLVVFSFVLAFVHFIVETAVTFTAPFAFSTISPLIISSGSTVLMLMAWTSLRQAAPSNSKAKQS